MNREPLLYVNSLAVLLLKIFCSMRNAMEQIAPEVVEIKARMERLNVRPSVVCKRAGVASSVWTRWATGTNPNTRTVRLLHTALDEITAEAIALGESLAKDAMIRRDPLVSQGTDHDAQTQTH